MAIQIFDCEQNSPEWYAARAGIPTASMFATVMASGRGGGPSLTRAKYMRELVGERITGEVEEGYTNAHMERGKERETEARDLYAFLHDEPLTQVGFIRNGDKGYSPDSLAGTKGLVEVKTTLSHIQIDILLKDQVPPEHMAQCQGGLWVAEREWLDLVIYRPKLPLFVKRVYRDEAYIATMAKAVRLFNEELAEMEAAIRKLFGERVAA
ncbi:lambda exonuclease family protein [uncultured Devosia sp.]|uniref:lambda exonuclease family protein n=1 Tax=uncultured Devosia sp. TaxID=211434 RepID=UPI00261729C7|nr:lambda exonuclease family protein [uncultured Devosia sp.]